MRSAVRWCGVAGALALVTTLGPTPAARAATGAKAVAADDARPHRERSTQAVGGIVPGSYIVRYADGVDPAAVSGSIGGATGQARRVGKVDRVLTAVFPGAVVHASASEAESLRRDPRVASVEPDRLMKLEGSQASPPWGLDRTDQREPSPTGRYLFPNTALGVTAYIVDSGIRASHIEFGGRVRHGVNTIEDGVDQAVAMNDCYGHGTHVAGTVGSTTYGVAKSVSLVNVRSFDCEGFAYDSEVIAAFEWVVADHVAGAPAVMNVSSGGPPSDAIDAAVNGVLADGITVVVSAGNESTDACAKSPARVPAAITVAASTPADQHAYFSNFGPCVDLYAPGYGVLSTFNSSDYATLYADGTSMSAPHVTGAAALLLAQMPWLDPGSVATTLAANATHAISPVAANTTDRLLFVSPFQDVPATYPFAADITWLATNGITLGFPNSTYQPLASVSREAMAAFLYRAAGSPRGTSPTCSVAAFADVLVTAPFCGEIKWLVDSGITTGSGGLFKPKAPVTREAMAAFMYRWSGQPLGQVPPCTSAPFIDVQVGSTFCGEITWLVSEHIATGYPDSSFRGSTPVTRQAMAAFLHRLLT